jgi:GNAT superfamily N-acetyltransferase/ABC-type ATPase involved in cell division
MPRYDVVAECDVHDSFRVQQVAGMFDVSLAEKCRQEFSVEVPGLDENWQIGAIVGPSGSGKSTIAREAFDKWLYTTEKWPEKKAVVDAFGKLPVKQITGMLTAVGFSSPPSWVKPYDVLSNGEKFRCDLARALLRDSPLVVFDEFTSVVDRTVAKIGSAAVSKSLRDGKISKRFVAVTCHYDVVEWLEPDWVLDMATGTLERRRLRRPPIELALYRGKVAGWKLFARHHYLNATLAPSAVCYYALHEGRPVGICALLPMLGKKGRRRVSRIVVLPDYQGVGIGVRLLHAACDQVRAAGNRVSITTGHPAMISHLKRSPAWRICDVKKIGAPKPGWKQGSGYKASTGRAVVSAEYRGEPTPLAPVS